MAPIVANLRRPSVSLLLSVAIILIVTAILIAVEVENRPAAFLARPRHVIFAYVLPVAAVAIISGSLAALAASIASGLCAVYFLYLPSFSFYVDDPLDIAELGFFLLFVSLGSHAMASIYTMPGTHRRRRLNFRCPSPRSHTGSAPENI
jgi:K+-sensing histidine kinase KdpD